MVTPATTNELLKTPRQSGWTAERRAAHAAAIRRWKPWERSTGPRTAAGKARAARNAWKHGGRSRPLRIVSRLLSRQARFLREIRLHIRAYDQGCRVPRPRGGAGRLVYDALFIPENTEARPCP